MAPVPDPAGQTLVEACAQWVKIRIDTQTFGPGTRLPSIRGLARQRGVSPFTVAEAYGRLVAQGYAEPRRGSGFYVLRRDQPVPAVMRTPSIINFTWLLHHMLQGPEARGPGVGVLPASWLGGLQIAASLRALGREGPGQWLRPGESYGFMPLREVLQARLFALDILARTDQIVLTSGVTQGFDLVLRALAAPGEAVLCLDPFWFGALGTTAAHGAQLIAAPLGPDGPNLERLEQIACETRPKLFILSSMGHNPTGLRFSPEVSAGALEIARRYDFHIIEDDVYADLCDTPVQRLATMDGLERVIYAGSFSKTIASNVRVGFLACAAPLAARLSDAKVLTGFTTPELNERLVHRLLVGGRFAEHLRKLRARLAERRTAVLAQLDAEGVPVFGTTHEGMFLWVDMNCDTNHLAAVCGEQGLLIAPGALFSPHQRPSPWMRLNITARTQDIASTIMTARSLPLFSER